MTAAVASARHDYGVEATQHFEHSADDLQQLVLGCNKDGMDFLRKGQYKQAFEQLKYAEAVLEAKTGGEEEPTNLLAVTCNNLGCYYKKVGKLHAALSYLRKALKIEVSLQTDDATVAGTHLNICAILSKLDKHDKAVQHAMCALELISARVNSGSESVSQEEYSVLAIAYHNVAVERDYMRQWDQAAAAYQEGHQIAKKCLGDQHPLTQTLSRNCETAAQKVQKQPSRHIAAPLSSGVPAGAAEDASPPPPPAGSGGSMLPEIGGPASAREGGKEFMTPREVRPNSLGNSGGFAAPSAATVRQEASEWVQSEETAAWRHAAPSQLPPLGPTGTQPLGRFQAGGAFMGKSHLPDSGAALGADAPWPQPSFLDRIVQDVPTAAGFANPPPSPPPLVVMGGAGQGGRAARSRFHEEFPGPLAQPPPPLQDPSAPSKDAGRSASQSARSRRAVPGTFVPAPPAGGCSGRPPRGSSARRREQRGGAAQSGSLASDQAPAGGLPGGVRAQHSQLLRKSAAEKIQRAWRAHYSHRTQNSSRRKKENLAATKIQARWRGFRVIRRKQHHAATRIQTAWRGFRVRLAVRRLQAATRVQRHARGMLFRRDLARRRAAAVRVQRFARGTQARREVNNFRVRAANATLLLQRAARRWKAYKIVEEKRKERAAADARQIAATQIQSVFRGKKGRKRFEDHRRSWEAVEHQNQAAVKLQAMVRRKQAKVEVDNMRQVKEETQSKAATTVRKYWLRQHYRRKFLRLRQELRMHEDSVVTIQRYVRGFLVRSRMWRDAIRAEDELWGAIEIQRCWRGYLGRVRWEIEYDAVHSRQVAAERLQRHIRGWLARTRAHRIRKRNARADFEKARRRFKAAQRVQALTRGVQCRKRIQAFKQRKIDAAVKIQSVHRGHRLRRQLWEHVLLKRTVQIQAAMRGFLVRNRRFHVIAKVICVQRAYRKWLRWVPEAERARRVEAWRVRRAEARAAAEEAALGRRP